MQVTGERQHGERLERETHVCQEKMRALRDENVRLAERCAELEAQLPQQRAAPTGLRRSAGAGIANMASLRASSSQAAEACGRSGVSRARSGPPSQPMGIVAVPGSGRRRSRATDAETAYAHRGRAVPFTPSTPRAGRSYVGYGTSTVASFAALSNASCVGTPRAITVPSAGESNGIRSVVPTPTPIPISTPVGTAEVPVSEVSGSAYCPSGVLLLAPPLPGGTAAAIAAAASDATSAVGAARDLQYLVNWVRSEECRLASPPAPTTGDGGCGSPIAQ